jgi:16S rRNA (cytidine1402-2'-O)-methyltransferase
VTNERDKEPRPLAPGLYLVATPIGNLGDISSRALAVLRTADLVLAEDTRRTRKLFSHFGIRNGLRAHHEHNEAQATPGIVENLRSGAAVALVSDAGTPGISDPGYRLVAAAIEAGVPIVPIPGPSAPIAALVASGLPTHRFAFVGYPPRAQAAARRFFESLAAFDGSLVLFESPRRLSRTLRVAAKALGPGRRAAVARELTKAYEEFIRGTLGELSETLANGPLRGEITLCIEGATPIPELPASDLPARFSELLANGIERREALRQLAREAGMNRRDVYRAVVLGEPTVNEPDGE